MVAPRIICYASIGETAATTQRGADAVPTLAGTGTLILADVQVLALSAAKLEIV